MPIPFLTAEWRSLAMLNYSVEPGLLEPFVPAGLELDLFDGVAYVSLVGFLFLDCRVMGVPVPLHRNFEEVNLRFYVVRRIGGELRRGVVFLKEIVPRAAIAWTARAFYNEPYTAMPMRHAAEPRRVGYGWKSSRRWHSFDVDLEGEPALAEEGSEQEFITEHYWGYCAQRDGGCVEYRVDHPRWKIWTVAASTIEVDFAEIYGERFAPSLQASPSSAFVADGSAISVGWPQRI
ncbi:MAG: DUF2071 domain-containing protein [Bryobacterales bacterium]